MRKLFIAAAAGALLLGAGAAQAATYVAYDQFQIAGGVVTATDFEFGYVSGAFAGAITAFPTIEAACGGNANILCARNGDVSVSKASAGAFAIGTVFYTDGFLNMHPSAAGDLSVVQFVAPGAGTYNFAGSFAIHDAFPTGVDVAAYVGAASQFSQLLTSGSRAFDFDATLAAGDRVSFVLGAAGNYTFDSTGLNLTVSGGVPEPAGWAMMILGFGGVGAMARRRRIPALA